MIKYFKYIRGTHNIKLVIIDTTENRWSVTPIQHEQQSRIWDAVTKEILFRANSSTGMQQGCEVVGG